ncbi:MAG: PHP domain-containing protein [Bacillota bacterium]|nr:PHP domain-containing protein [Bacillota bacterium]
MKLYDLHIHTTASDGVLSPAQAVGRAKALGLSGISITDHDTVAGLEEALCAGAAAGIEVITGVEFSVESEKEMHILGYCIGRGERLGRALAALNDARRERNPVILQKLCGLGMDITIGEVEKEAGGNVVGRPHIARVMMKKGYVESMKEAFDRYLAIGRPGYAHRKKLRPASAIRLIRKESGHPVLAHPKLLHMPMYELEQLVAALAKEGLWGIEAYYPSHTAGEAGQYCKIAKRYGLFITSGSDFHDGIRSELDMGCTWNDDEKLLRSLEILIHSNQKALHAG